MTAIFYTLLLLVALLARDISSVRTYRIRIEIEFAKGVNGSVSLAPDVEERHF